MDFLVTIFAFILLIGIIVGIHEGGHYLAAVLSNIKVLEFSLGFGPKIYEKKFGKDKTLFTLRILPLGGFVKPLEESALSKEDWNNLSQEDKQRSFSNASKWKKAFMVAGGPTSNFILAFFLFVFLYAFKGAEGTIPQIESIDKNSFFSKYNLEKDEIITAIDNKKVDFANEALNTINNSAIIGKSIVIETNKKTINVNFQDLNLKDFKNNLKDLLGINFIGKIGDIKFNKINQDSPADKAGIKQNDLLVSFNNNSNITLNQTLKFIKENPEEKLLLTIKRNSELINVEVIPTKEKDTNFGKIGVSLSVENPTNLIIKKYSILETIDISYNKLKEQTLSSLISIKKLLFGELSTKAISGPITIAEYSGKSFNISIFSYIFLMATISIGVGVFNLLPVPMLDGGHLLQYAVETITHRDFSENQLKIGQYIGLSFMAFIFIFSIFNDITRLL